MYARQRPCKTCGQVGSSPALLASRGRRAPISSRHRAAQPPPRPAGRARPVPPPPRPAPTAAAPRGARRRACAPQREARRCRRGAGRAPPATRRSRDPRLPVHDAGARWKDRPRVRLLARRIKTPAGVTAPRRGRYQYLTYVGALHDGGTGWHCPQRGSRPTGAGTHTDRQPGAVAQCTSDCPGGPRRACWCSGCGAS